MRSTQNTIELFHFTCQTNLLIDAVLRVLHRQSQRKGLGVDELRLQLQVALGRGRPAQCLRAQTGALLQTLGNIGLGVGK